MSLTMVIVLIADVYFLAVLLILGLCRAAADGDEMLALEYQRARSAADGAEPAPSE